MNGLTEIYQGCRKGRSVVPDPYLEPDSGVFLEKNEDDWMSFPRRRTMSSSIARHKRARQRRIATEVPSSSTWKLVRYPALIFFRWCEKRALSDLIALAPANADDARQKLVYLIAAMVADPATSDAIAIANAIETLKPFEGTLAHCLTKRRTPL